MKQNKIATKLTICLILVIVSGILLSILLTVNAEGQTAELPKRTVGDKWKFMIDYKGTVGRIGTHSLEVTNDKATIGNYECLEYSINESGTVYGQDISGTWSMTGKAYDVKSDHSIVKEISSLDATITNSEQGTKWNQSTETTYDPPVSWNKGFPISAGKNWSTMTTVTTTTKLDVDGVVTQETTPVAESVNYMVVRTETTKVTAGEFETFVIKCTNIDGSIQERYYSPKARLFVKELYYDAEGNLSVSMELLEYNVAEQGIPLIYIVGATVGAIAIVGISVGFVIIKKRGARKIAAS